MFDLPFLFPGISNNYAGFYAFATETLWGHTHQRAAFVIANIYKPEEFNVRFSLQLNITSFNVWVTVKTNTTLNCLKFKCDSSCITLIYEGEIFSEHFFTKRKHQNKVSADDVCWLIYRGSFNFVYL